MKKVQLFSGDSVEGLQQKINKWLAKNKDANVIETNLSVISKPGKTMGSPGIEIYTFYILYSIVNEEAKEMEMEELAEEITPSIAQTEIKENLLKSSN